MAAFALTVIAIAITLLNICPLLNRPNSQFSLLNSQLTKVWNVLLTFLFISFTRLFFRSGSNLDPATANEVAWNTATQMVNSIGSTWNLAQIPTIVSHYSTVFGLFALGMAVHWLPERFKRRYRLWFASMPLWAMALVVTAIVLVVMQFVSADLQPFIYFQF